MHSRKRFYFILENLAELTKRIGSGTQKIFVVKISAVGPRRSTNEIIVLFYQFKEKVSFRIFIKFTLFIQPASLCSTILNIYRDNFDVFSVASSPFFLNVREYKYKV